MRYKALLRKLDVNESKQVFNEACETQAYQMHSPYSIAYYLKCKYDDTFSFYASSGNNANCLDWFIKELNRIIKWVAGQFSIYVKMDDLNADEERLLNDPETKCGICGGSFEANEPRARDHDHRTGKFRNVAHMKCNLNYQESRVIPIIMHNLSGYDLHMLIKKISSGLDGDDLSIIPINTEHYISITKTVWGANGSNIKVRFIDSFRFMPASLSQLASLIPSEKKHILHSVCEKDYTKEQITMLERKGVFPYDYVDSFDRLSETSLPAKEQFYNELNEEEISTQEYEFACDIWKKFGLKTLGEYSELYMKTDVLLLADVFENFRNTCHSIYKLDPAHYYTAPGLSFDAMLKYTNVKIELLTDVEMLLFVENGIRGGIAQCSKRHVKANNKYMGDAYKPNEKSIYLMYLDGMCYSFYCILYI